MSGHTPGKWGIFDNGQGSLYVASDNGAMVAFIQSDEENEDADADLICAAPELLDALRGMIVSYELEASPLNPALLKARAALAKATGGAE